MSNQNIADLAAIVYRLQRQVASMSKPSLSYSSLEDGAITEYDLDGTQVAQYGQQFDGTHMAASLAGPPPPMPTTPIAQPVIGGVLVGWDGEWVTADQAPMDFARVEVHASKVAGFTAVTSATLVGTIETPRGATFMLPTSDYDAHHFVFVARSLSGKASVQSLEATATPLRIGAADLDASAVAGATLYFQASAPTGLDDNAVAMWVDTDDGNKSYRWGGTAAGWVQITDQRVLDAIAAAAAAQTSADSKIKTYAQASAPIGLTPTDVGDLWMDTDDGNSMHRWDGAAWQPYLVGDGAISALSVNKLITGEIAVGQRVIAGPANAGHAELNDSGLQAFSANPDGGAPLERIRVGTDGDDFLGITDDAGQLVMGISADGVVSGARIDSADDPTGAGRPILGRLQGIYDATDILENDPTRDYDVEPTGWAEILPRGIVAWSQSTAGTAFPTVSNSECGLVEISYDLENGRLYTLNFSDILYNVAPASAGSTWIVALVARYTLDGTQPTVTSPIAARNYISGIGSTASRFHSLALRDRIVGGSGVQGTLRVLFTILASGCTVTPFNDAGLGNSPTYFIRDEGINKTPYARVTHGGGATTGGGTPDPDPPAPAPKTYTALFSASGSQSYKGSGAKRTDTTDLVQGNDPSGFNGNQQGYAFFGAMTGVLTGATITKIEVYLYANHWYYDSGGTARIAVHGYSSAPVAGPVNTYAGLSTRWPKPGGRWVTLPSSLYAGFKSGAYRGIAVGPGGTTDLLYYGRFDGTGTRRPKIRITYKK